MPEKCWTKITLDEIDLEKMLNVTALKFNLVVNSFDEVTTEYYDGYRSPEELAKHKSDRLLMTVRLDECETWQQARHILLKFDLAHEPNKDLATRLLCVRRIASFFLKEHMQAA